MESNKSTQNHAIQKDHGQKNVSSGTTSADPAIEDGATGVPTAVSAIQTPIVQAAAEAPTHTGQTNVVDPYLYTNYIQMATFSWSTAQLAGTKLWYTPIHPSRGGNSIVAHVAKMYNAWGGSLDYRLKIAGTGFHAGALGVARLPPNLHPSKITTTKQLTAFEWQYIDPKKIETQSYLAIDQRQVMYHYTNFDEENTATFGGWLVFFVLQKLNTSSTGTNQVDVSVFMRLGQDFEFTQIVPPDLMLASDESNVDAFQLMFPKTYPWEDPYLNNQITELKIYPSTVPGIVIGQYGMVSQAGVPIQQQYVKWPNTAVRKADGTSYKLMDPTRRFVLSRGINLTLAGRAPDQTTRVTPCFGAYKLAADGNTYTMGNLS